MKLLIATYLEQTRLYRGAAWSEPPAQVENAHFRKRFDIKLHDFKSAREEHQREGRITVIEESGRLQLRLRLPQNPGPDRE